jgi:hypothetical protein
MPSSKRTSDPAPPPAETAPGHVCTVAFCPIALTLSAVEPLKPDVIEHLLVAGREFFLAAKAVMDARAEELGREGTSPTRLEKIDIA